MARCKVCRRELKNADHIRAGMGPVCAAKAIRSGSDRVARAYPAERHAKIVKACMLLADQVSWARQYGTAWDYSIARHWLDRLARMEVAARKQMRIGK